MSSFPVCIYHCYYLSFARYRANTHTLAQSTAETDETLIKPVISHKYEGADVLTRSKIKR